MTKENFLKITEHIGALIKGTEFEGKTYVVGGACRDYFMERPIKDIDLVIELPDGGIRLAEYFKERDYCEKVVIYPTYGTAMFCLKEYPDIELECVMTRGEKYPDKESRNPVCVFDTLDADAMRRDLTINAIYYNLSTQLVIDPTGGFKDISENSPLRVTNENPDIVFEDDPLRILRVIRFSTRLNKLIADSTYNSMVKNVDRLSIISKERIRDEFNKIIMDKNAVVGLKLLRETGAMKYVIPELIETYDMGQNEYHFGTVWEHTLALVRNYHQVMRGERGKPDLITILACILHDIGKPATRSVKNGKIHFYDHELVGSKMVNPILRNLHYDNDTIAEVSFLVKNHMRTKMFKDDMVKMKPKSFNKLAYECGSKERWLRLAAVIECDNMSHKTEHNIRGHFVTMFASLPKAAKMFDYKLPVNGDDVMKELGLKPSRMVKLIVNKLLKRAFNDPTISRESCLKSLPKIHEQVKKDLETK